jgi:hypothetical protein
MSAADLYCQVAVIVALSRMARERTTDPDRRDYIAVFFSASVVLAQRGRGPTWPFLMAHTPRS